MVQPAYANFRSRQLEIDFNSSRCRPIAYRNERAIENWKNGNWNGVHVRQTSVFLCATYSLVDITLLLLLLPAALTSIEILTHTCNRGEGRAKWWWENHLVDGSWRAFIVATRTGSLGAFHRSETGAPIQSLALFFCRQRTLLSICPSSVLYIYTFPIIAGNDINLGSTEDTERGTRPAGSTLSESTLNLPCYISQSYRGFSAAGRNIWIALRVVGETGKRCRHGASVDSLRRHFHAAL